MDKTDTSTLLATYLARREDLVRYFRVRLRSEEAAEDLVQDIYVKIQGLSDEGIDNPSGFLFRLGTNLMLDQIKQRKRSGRRDAEWRGANTTSAGWEVMSDASPADAVADARQRLARIIEVVKELPPQVQEAFRLHKLEGLTHTETAAAMNVSKSSVEKYMMTCLKQILAKVGR
ncbi:MAG: RNA polymerase sigma factor [Phenylobacterium sp.]